MRKRLQQALQNQEIVDIALSGSYHSSYFYQATVLRVGKKTASVAHCYQDEKINTSVISDILISSIICISSRRQTYDFAKEPKIAEEYPELEAI